MSRLDVAADPYFRGTPTDPKDWIAAELVPGERVVWSGRPRARLAWHPTVVHGLALVAGGLLWVAVAEAIAPVGGGAWLPGVVAVGFGLVECFAALASTWERAGMSYVLTDRRALIRTPCAALPGGASVRSFEPWALGAMTTHEHADGSGDLIFEEIRVVQRAGQVEVTRHGFLAIEAVHAVADLVRSTLLDRQPRD